jgi:hypothetical protein
MRLKNSREQHQKRFLGILHGALNLFARRLNRIMGKNDDNHELLLMGKRIDLDNSPIVYNLPFGPDSLEKDWQVRSAKWHVDGDWLCGVNAESKPGMVTSRHEYLGNVLLDFQARTVAPSKHDIDWMWNGSWDCHANARGVAYVGGLQGWWEGKVGIEKSPDYKLTATTQLFPFEAGRIYHIQSGSIDGHCFIFVEGKLVLEVTDPNPVNSQCCGMIGFEAYASMIQVRRLVVRQIVWQERSLHYAQEF